jgi:hypothetical protein
VTGHGAEPSKPFLSRRNQRAPACLAWLHVKVRDVQKFALCPSCAPWDDAYVIDKANSILVSLGIAIALNHASEVAGLFKLGLQPGSTRERTKWCYRSWEPQFFLP